LRLLVADAFDSFQLTQTRFACDFTASIYLNHVSKKQQLRN